MDNSFLNVDCCENIITEYHTIRELAFRYLMRFLNTIQMLGKSAQVMYDSALHQKSCVLHKGVSFKRGRNRICFAEVSLRNSVKEMATSRGVLVPVGGRVDE